MLHSYKCLIQFMKSQPVQQCHPTVFTLWCPCVCVCVFSLTGLSVVLHTAAVAPVWVGRGAITTNAGFHQAEKGPEWNKNDLAQYAPSFLSLFFSFQLGWWVFSDTNNADLLVHYAINAIMYPPKPVALIFCGRTWATSLFCAQGRLTLIQNDFGL